MKRPATKTIVIASLTLVGAAALFAANFFSPNLQPYGYIAPPATSSTNFASGNETLYAPWFETGTFTGDLLAIPVATDGSPDSLNPDWRAWIKVGGQDPDTGRFIVTTTRDASNVLSVIPFRWPSLSTDQRIAMDSVNTGNATSPVLDYVRGDRSREYQNGGTYRDRYAVLGDIIHSPPLYVGAPSEGLTFDGYPAFAVANKYRAPRVYVGANDGMLHAFDAAAGTEVFAFVPGEVGGNLPLLKRRPYLHQYFVDGSLINGDAIFPSDSAWHSVLVGGLGAGGQGFFALDITSAAAITAEDNSADGAGSRVLWEFTDLDDANMGFSYGRPSVVRLQFNSKWVAIVANGYVNNVNDGAQGDGKARLYALDIETGAKVGEIVVSDASDSALSPNGLSSPAVIDANSDFKADAVYAGDLKGNVWRFDISGDPALWSSSDATRLFTATDTNGAVQAITTPPDVTFHPQGGFLVYIGTGRLYDSDDLLTDDPLTGAGAQRNTVYALWD
jgi:Tfp pilus tip-associated adhesin PilY1